MGQWTNYDDNTSPATTWTILCYPGSGALQEVTLSNAVAAGLTSLVGANYARTLNMDGALSGTPQNVEVGGVASALLIANDEVAVSGPLSAETLAIGTDTLVAGETYVIMATLPTSDPTVAGALWLDVASGRVIKVSAG